MEVMRVVLATILFCMSSYLVYDLLVNGFSVVVLAACLFGYVTAHYMWPRNKIEDSAWYDLLELVIDIPFRSVAYILRSLGRVFRGSDAGVDFDL